MLWRTLHTRHFSLHYHEPLGLLARHVAANAERLQARIAGHLGLAPRARVHIVLSDGSDSANGSAGVLPYDVIRLNAASPEDMAPLGDYDDWLSLLLIHEHTHILHLNEASGLPRLLTRLFGKLYTPQQFLPRWVIEGLATYEESALTSGGRGRASLFEMYLRMAALDDRLLPLDQVTHDGQPWPHGHVRYLYGVKFLHFVAERHGSRALGRFAREYGRRLVPYGLSRAMKRATGRDIVSLYDAFLRDARRRAEATRARVRARGLVRGRRLTQLGEEVGTPRFLPDGRVVFYASDGRHVPDLRVLDPLRGTTRRLARVRGRASPSVIRQTGAVVYSSAAFHRGRYAFKELFLRSPDGGERQLTQGRRAREPDVSPDGQRVAYVVQGAGTTHLAVARLDNVADSERLLVRSARLEQVFTPRWSPDGARIAYSAWTRGGYRDLFVVDVRSGRRRRLTFDRALDRQPAWAPDGQTLYYSSDRGGISNLYALDLRSGHTSQVTNVLGGAFMPEVSMDGRALLYVGYTSVGFDLFLLPLDRALHDAPPSPRARPPALVARAAAPLASEAYRPWPSLAPRAYGVSLEDGANGRQLVVDTSGADAVGWHAWTLALATSLDDGRVGVAAEYALRRARMPLILRGALRERERRDLWANGTPQRWLAREWSMRTSTRLSLPAPFYAHTLAGDYTVYYLQPRVPLDVPLRPDGPAPQLPPLGRDAELGLSWTFDSVRRQVYDVSSSWGQRASVRLGLREPWLGSRRRSQSLSWSTVQFVPLGGRASVLALRYTGGWNRGVRLGGFASELVPILDALVAGAPRPADAARLRGFPARFGDRFHILQTECRFLLADILRGLHTLPVFARRLHAAFFSDVGDAYHDRRLRFERLGVSVGGELRLDFVGAYTDGYTLRVGLARGVTTGGTLQWYTSFARPF